MQNNYYNNNTTGEIRPASQSQIDYLIRLGFKGNTEGLTAAEASQYIKELNQANKQPQQPQPQYQPRPQQAQQAPQMQNNMPVKVEEFNPIITTRNGEELMLSKDIVDSYITSSGQPLTDTEYKYFFSVCKTYGLNPFLKDIYAIKFGTQPATFVIDYKVLQMACENHPAYDGLKTGVIVLDRNGNFLEREGAYILPNEILIGGWCDVYRKDRTHTNRTYALYEENKKTDKSGKVNTNWNEKPVFFIVKVAKAQALRETFPNLFSSSTYTTDENLGTANNEALERKANSFTPKEAIEIIETQQVKSEGTVKPQFEQEEINFDDYN